MQTFRLEAQGLSDAGIVKEINEDSYFYKIADVKDEMTGIFVVADGVGGLENGDVASNMAVVSVRKWWDNTYKKIYDEVPEFICASLIKSIQEVNGEIMRMAEKNQSKMATTMSVLLLHKNYRYSVHIGDSRIYRLKQKLWADLEQITVDQSCIIEKEVNGRHIQKSVLTDCIGAKTEFCYECTAAQLTGNEIFMLCSDGAYKRVEYFKIKKIIKKAKGNMQRVCKDLINTAKEKNETDNITVIAVNILKA